jgi:hypothetical protein
MFRKRSGRARRRACLFSFEIHALDQPILDRKNMPNLAIGENVALKVLHKLVHSNL